MNRIYTKEYMEMAKKYDLGEYTSLLEKELEAANNEVERLSEIEDHCEKIEAQNRTMREASPLGEAREETYLIRLQALRRAVSELDDIIQFFLIVEGYRNQQDTKTIGNLKDYYRILLVGTKNEKE